MVTEGSDQGKCIGSAPRVPGGKAGGLWAPPLCSLPTAVMEATSKEALGTALSPAHPTLGSNLRP